MMPSLSKAKGDLYTWKTDARFRFDDTVLRDLRFGMRLTKRSATHVDGSGAGLEEHCRAVERRTRRPCRARRPIPRPKAGQSRSRPSVPSAIRATGNSVPTTAQTLPNFFNGKVPAMPTMVTPTMAFTKMYPASYALVTKALGLECQDGNKYYGTTNDCSTADGGWKPLTYDGDPAQTSRRAGTHPSAGQYFRLNG
ncbi:hypothetical protein [Massilia phosphatilytica]